MRKIITILLLAVGIIASGLITMSSVTGCTTSQSRITFNTIYSVQRTVASSYDSYVDGVITGKFATNNFAAVSKRFDEFQSGVLLALAAVQFNTNAIAPPQLLNDSTNVIALITASKGN